MTGFQHDIAGGNGNLIAVSVQSPNFSPGSAGWQIARDGSAEFNNGVFRGVLTASEFQGADFIINQAGAFFYSGTPAAGNLIGSWATTAGSDEFGNSYPAGLTVVNSSGQGVQLNGDQLIFIGSHAFAGPGSSDAYLFAPPAAAVNQQSTIFVQSPTDNQYQAMLQMRGRSSDGSQEAGASFLKWDNVGGMVAGGLAILVGSVAATEPGTTGTPETWHSLAIPANWSDNSGSGNGFRYRLQADGTVLLSINLMSTTAPGSGGITLGTLPTGYRPSSNQNIPAATNMASNTANGQSPHIFVQTSGVIQAYGLDNASGVQVSVNAIILTN